MKKLRPLVLRVLGKHDVLVVVTVVSVIGSLLLWDALAWAARPGGGSSYSGGGSSSSSSSSGSYSGGGGGSDSGDGEALGFLIVLAIEHPVIGVPLLICFVGFMIVKAKMRSSAGREWSTVQPQSQRTYAPVVHHQEPLRPKLEAIRHTDPAFSIVVFEDFLYFLYAEMHRARGASSIDALAAYVGDDARRTLANDGRIAEVTGIIIGGLTYEDVDVDASGARVEVVVEANYVERYRPQGEQRFYVKERLTLTRAAGARSRTPDKARILTCPNCGGPISAMRGTMCTYCNTQIQSGTKDWAITEVELEDREMRGPLLTSSVEEQGTNLPTIVNPHARNVFAQMQHKDPQLSWQRFEHRVGTIFQEFHAGWVGRDPSKVRPYVSDNLFQSQLYWIDLYRNARCINRTDGSRILRIEIANATTDAYYDALTVRLFATGLDFTVSEDGRVLSGNPRTPRTYSEYWTLIRGAQKKATNKGDKQCPNCGAPLAINMAGNCQYCQVKVTSGEYDWVLSRIEQDEAYTG